MKTEISHIKLDNGQEIRVVEEAREGSTLFVRPLGEKEVDKGETVKFDPEEEQLVLTEPVYGASLHTTGEAGCKQDILTWVRVVPDGRDGSTVYGRTLRSDEPDTGLAPQRRPGDNFAFRENSLVFSVDSVDISAATKFEDGYASIANTVWTWLSLYPTLTRKVLPDQVPRFLLSVARRLDASHEAFSLLHSKLKELETVEYGIRQRNLIFEIMGLVEMAIVAMNRALQMALQLHRDYSITTCFPESVNNKLHALRQMRNAYEHIEDRALGLVRGVPHIDALSIFNYERLFKEGIATYGQYELDIHNEAIQLLIDTRQYLKEATSELASNVSL
ncbi:hypothetical protein PN499_13205 [Kamptonema animale CS-326]|jgi:hypothetical protein|uniref:hypothetical protein n=1 Tax=Kamptonema animale TaxID=92934 RepID=UPI00232F10D4|nr:hypothetical protein [Kamptonema animale]MDB9512144.1 hypothetical protein [Kamptonema animale CS-326]